MYKDFLPQNTIRYELIYNGSKLSVLSTFINGKLQTMQVLDHPRPVIMSRTMGGSLESAKAFLRTYQSFTGDSFYGLLEATLSDVDETNQTKIIGNTKLQVTSIEQNIAFRWTYTLNGIEAPDKAIALNYENGFLKLFFDSWDLYTVGSTSLNVSEKESMNIAMTQAKNYSWITCIDNKTFVVSKYNVTGAMIIETVFRSSLVADKARSDDLLMLYPMRHVWVSLDKFYPGNVYGLNVYVWADTGEIARIQERFTTLDPPPELVASSADLTLNPVSDESTLSEESQVSIANQVSLFSLVPNGSLLFAFIIIIIVFAIIGLTRTRLIKKKLFNPSKFNAVLLCVLMLLLLIFPLIEAVSASYPQGRATIWGSRSQDAFNGYESWRKKGTEVQKQGETAAAIASSFSSNGYVATNDQGCNNDGSSKTAILEQLSQNDALYPRYAVIDFDHGNGNNYPGSNEFHYMFEDDHGTYSGTTNESSVYHPENGVYDMEIFPRTADGKIFFAFINTCNSAHYGANLGSYDSSPGVLYGDRARGMPFALTHHSPGGDMSGHGYDYPDSGDSVFLGFWYGSASLSQTIEGSGPYYYTWCERFFNDALTYDVSVNDALDSASSYCWSGYAFWQTPLYQGFVASWPMYEDWNQTGNPFWQETFSPENRMGYLKVYGNGNIHLYQKSGVWNFDENAGSTAYDCSNLQNHLTINGATWSTGRNGYALSFDGLNDYAYKSYSTSLNGLSGVTLMEWVKLNSVPSSYSFDLGGTLYEYWLEYRDNQYLSLSTYVNSQYDGMGFYANLADGKWHLITMTYDGIYKKGYLDGTLMASYYLPGTLDTTYNSFTVGSSWSATQGYNGCPDGLIDEVRVYNYAFSSKQIADEASAAAFHLNGGDVAYDSSPNGNTGTIVEGSWVGVPISVGSYGLSFDGSDDYVNVPDSSSLDITSAVTVEAWIKPDRLDVWQSPLEKGIHQDWAYGFYIEPSGGNIGFEIGLEGQQVAWAGATAPVNSYLAVGRWSHIVGTADSATGVACLYIDGVEVSQGSFSGQINQNSIPFQIGKRSDGGFFGGQIDEIRIYNRAIAPEEVAYNYGMDLPYIWITTWTTDDTYSNQIETTFYVDSHPLGGLGSHQYELNGEHSVEVNNILYHAYYGWYQFSYFTIDNGNPIYDNPMTVPITRDCMVTAHYNWYDYP
jgi:hypothetical protein